LIMNFIAGKKSEEMMTISHYERGPGLKLSYSFNFI